jgi:hypothetical protein
MSWEYRRYEAKCDACGHTGFCIEDNDDRGRSSTTWEGFENRPPNPYAVAQKRTDPSDYAPICKCGSTTVIVGKLIEIF